MGGASATASFDTAMLRSMLISADMAHAIHPNYMEKHEELHRPKMNGGVVIKQNANQRYATNSVTSLVLKEVCIACVFFIRVSISCVWVSFVCPCRVCRRQRCAGKCCKSLSCVMIRRAGAPSGPCCLPSSECGRLMVRCVLLIMWIVGNPQWSMHSIRETCGSQDVEKAIVLFTAWFENYSKISARIVVD